MGRTASVRPILYHEMRRVSHTSGLSFYEESSQNNLDMIRRILVWIAITASAVFLGVLFTLFLGFRVTMSTGAMSPGIEENQQVLINRLTYRMMSPAAGDVVAYYPGGNQDTYPSISRVIATAGQTVQVADGRLLVNGIPYSNDPIYSDITYAGIAEQIVTLGEDECFVLGDNTAASEDSRSPGIGAIKENAIIGRVWLRLPHIGSKTGAQQE